MDGIKIKLHKANGVMNIQGNLYTPYCRMTEGGIITAKGVPVLFVNDNTILADSDYINNIYKKQSRWLGFKTEYVHVTPNDSIEVSIDDTLGENQYRVN